LLKEQLAAEFYEWQVVESLEERLVESSLVVLPIETVSQEEEHEESESESSASEPRKKKHRKKQHSNDSGARRSGHLSLTPQNELNEEATEEAYSREKLLRAAQQKIVSLFPFDQLLKE